MTEETAEIAHLVLARKYRPQRFGDLVGQEHVVETLRNAIESGRLAHAYLFTGIRGVGKTTAARLLARSLNCERSPKPTASPCSDLRDACGNCKEIAESRSIDVAEIDGASNRGIDNIRELNDNVRYLPVKSRFRIYIIDEAHMVTKEGFNALLKTLEEPPPHVKFVFATTAIDKFPETIVSRCQRYDFKRIPHARISAELRRISLEESVSLSDDALYQIAREAEGSMRDAESLLERLIAFAGKEIDDRTIAEILAVADRKTLQAAAEAILAGDARRALEVADQVYQAGWDLERFSRDLLEHWRNLVVLKIFPDRSALEDFPESEVAELRRQAGLRSLAELQQLFRISHRGDEELRRTDHPRLVFEMMMVRLATVEPAVPVDEVLERLEEMARGVGGSRSGPAPSRSVSTDKIERPTGLPRVPETRTASPAETVSGPPPTPGNGGGPSSSRWEEFLSFVQKTRISLFLTLSQARALVEAPGRLVIGVAKEFSRKELARRETLSVLEDLAREFFGQPMRVSVEAVEETSVPPAPPPAPAELLENPAIRKAVEILGGEVREIRNRRG